MTKPAVKSLLPTKFKHSLAVQDAALLVLEAMEGELNVARTSACVQASIDFFRAKNEKFKPDEAEHMRRVLFQNIAQR